MPWTFFLCFGGLFGSIASAAAYIILYREHLHRFEAAKARRMALKGAAIAFLFFLSLAIISGYVLSHYIISD